MKVRLAYIEEPPFGWTEADGRPVGADIDLAEVILGKIGVTQLELHATTFSELLPGLEAGLWDLNVPLFVTPERSLLVAFSRPVWAIDDGFLVQSGNPKSLTCYEAVAARPETRLGVITGQVQHATALQKLISETQIRLFETQQEALNALELGRIDAYASTAVGNRVLEVRYPDAGFEAVAHSSLCRRGGRTPVGAYSFNQTNLNLINAFNEELVGYLGSNEHRDRMAMYGLTASEIDPVLSYNAAS
jgi:polar amino acid transport system substrate-binding protein